MHGVNLVRMEEVVAESGIVGNGASFLPKGTQLCPSPRAVARGQEAFRPSGEINQWLRST